MYNVGEQDIMIGIEGPHLSLLVGVSESPIL